MSLIESIKYITPFSKNYVKESISEPDLQGFLCTQIIDEFQQMYACQNKTKCRMSKGKKELQPQTENKHSMAVDSSFPPLSRFSLFILFLLVLSPPGGTFREDCCPGSTKGN